MKLEIIHTKKAPAAIGPYSQAVVAGTLLFVSGQIGIKPETGELIGSDFSEQARQALENVRQVLVAAGSGMERVTAVDVFLTGMGNFSTFNRIYEEYFSPHRPARAVVAVRELPKGALVEIKCIAYRE